MDWVDDLRAILPPPAEVRSVPAPADWARVEGEAKSRFPDDYKEFLAIWGQAYVGGFLFPYSPAADTPSASELGSNVEYVSRALSSLKAHNPASYTNPVFPEEGGFLAGGRTDNGDFIGWMTIGQAPEQWPAAVWGTEDRAPQVFQGMGFGELMLGIVSGEVRPEAFPGDLWDDLPLPLADI